MKRLACTLSAILIGIGCISYYNQPVSASGIKDLNGDNQYTIADVVLLANFISGAVDYNGVFTDLDINGNYIIDQVYVAAYLHYFAS